MHQIPLEEAAIRLPQLIQEAKDGEDVVITQDNQPVARLVPLTSSHVKRQRGSAKGLILSIAEDFEAPLEDFKEYS